MAIAEEIEIFAVGARGARRRVEKLPDYPGVYFYYDASGELLYIGKATSLKKRVSSYFNRKHGGDVYGRRISKMVGKISRIEFIETGTVIEALVLEANKIRSLGPTYNVKLMDDKSFLFLVFTREDFPKPLFVRGLELSRDGIDPFDNELVGMAREKYLRVYGPFTSPVALRKSMDLLRKIFPWSVCESPEVSGKTRACFYSHIHLCPGVCSGAISKRDYMRNIRGLIQFFDGKRGSIITRLKREMKVASDSLEFERAQVLKRQIWALEHIRDVSVITRDFSPLPYENPDKGFVNVFGRVEAFDISNISGTATVGSMVVFVGGKPLKSAYRKFRIKTVDGVNDVGAMSEMIERRLIRAERFVKAWRLPDIFVIDGGVPQVNAVEEICREHGVEVPVVGLAKGPDRKQDVLIYDKSNIELSRVVYGQKVLFQKARDEAHRFAVKYHRELRAKRFLKKK